GKAEVVYGSRVTGAKVFGTDQHSYFSFYLGGRFLSLLTNLLYNTHITDEPTCYKVFKREVLEKLPELRCTRFEFCPEVTAKVAIQGHKIYEVPVHYHPRSRKEGKKISWQDGMIAILTLLKYRIKSLLARID
ncbi:MAG: glycosyltransferase family 2 protein, partial [bacterium]